MPLPILVVQHAAAEGPGLLADAFAEAGVPLETRRTFAGEAVPKDPQRFSAIVVMGGPMGVYEAARHPHLRDEIVLAEVALRRGVPILGVCLGSQILAAAAGARVFPGGRKEIGWHPIRTHPAARDDAVLRALPDGAVVFHWHGDTFDLPATATLLASSDAYPHQAFRIGAAAYGLQFHPEVTPGMVDRFVAEGAPEVAEVCGASGAARLRAEARRFAPPLAPVVRRAARGFLETAGLI